MSNNGSIGCVPAIYRLEIAFAALKDTNRERSPLELMEAKLIMQRRPFFSM